MLTLQEYKNRYKNEIKDFGLTEKEILKAYSIYCEDPFQYHPSMITQVIQD